MTTKTNPYGDLIFFDTKKNTFTPPTFTIPYILKNRGKTVPFWVPVPPFAHIESLDGELTAWEVAHTFKDHVPQRSCIRLHPFSKFSSKPAWQPFRLVPRLGNGVELPKGGVRVSPEGEGNVIPLDLIPAEQRYAVDPCFRSNWDLQTSTPSDPPVRWVWPIELKIHASLKDPTK